MKIKIEIKVSSDKEACQKSCPFYGTNIFGNGLCDLFSVELAAKGRRSMRCEKCVAAEEVA